MFKLFVSLFIHKSLNKLFHISDKIFYQNDKFRNNLFQNQTDRKGNNTQVVN